MKRIEKEQVLRNELDKLARSEAFKIGDFYVSDMVEISVGDTIILAPKMIYEKVKRMFEIKIKNNEI